MTTPREVKLRIRSVKNIAQVTRALQAVSASKVRRAMQALMQTRPYATKAWQVLKHIADQPDRGTLHPLLTERTEVHNVIVVMISGDRGLAGAYNTNILRYTLQKFGEYEKPVRYIGVGRKGCNLLLRTRKELLADFSRLPDPATFMDVSPIGHLAVEEFLAGNADEIYLVYADFVNMLKQIPTVKKLLPLEVDIDANWAEEYGNVREGPSAAYIYEPDPVKILDEIIPRFTALQVYEAVLEAQASEHAARMVAMQSATENANELADFLQLAYNKARQQMITSEMLDIAGGAEALTQALAQG